MKFVDEATITVQSGNGGRGCVSFRRERSVPRGGPNGGDGGKGGDVALVTSARRRTLQQFRFKRDFAAQNGAPGLGKNKTGKNGVDLLIQIPPGTLVIDPTSGDTIQDLVRTGEHYVVARGGLGGKGNARFKTSTNRAPRYAQPGIDGEERTLKLELKLLADVGLVGLPNAGKSTLISVLSSAKPRIANYPFTTLTPNLGVVHTDWGEPFVVADIPGLIEGAHEGSGLGDRFLRHIERTRIIVHLIDLGQIDPLAPLETYNIINRELEMYNPKLRQKRQLIALNKSDLPHAAETIRAFQDAAGELPFVTLSAKNKEGVDHLKSHLIRMLDLSDET